jgi:hypothetical protein
MRHVPWLRDEAPFVVVALILLVAVGYLTIWPDHWRRGIAIIALAALVGGVLRLVLPRPRAGMLVVRARWFDVACYLVIGGVILGVAVRLH